MQEKLVNLLIEKNLTITTVESCTGGMISSLIVDVSNASKVFNMSFVTYSDESKENIVGVSKDIILKYGVVSEEVTYEMALGGARLANSDIAIAVSGIAGPTGATKTKPIGMVCFGYYVCGKVYTETINFTDIGRNNVRKNTALYAIKKIIEYIEGM